MEENTVLNSLNCLSQRRHLQLMPIKKYLTLIVNSNFEHPVGPKTKF